MDESCEAKLKFVFRELLKSDYRVSDDTILEKLLTHLSAKRSDGTPTIKNFTECTEWVRCALQLWQQEKIEAPIVSFALRLLGIVLEDEERFTQVQSAAGGVEFFQHLLQMIEKHSHTSSNFSVKYAQLKLLSSMVRHSSGRRWIVLSRVWVNVLHVCQTDSSIYVVREGRQLLSALVNECPLHLDGVVEELMAHVLDPVVTFFHGADEASLTPRKKEDTQKLIPTLHLLSDILAYSFLKSDPKTNKLQSVVVHLVFRPRFKLLSQINKIISVADEEEVLELASKIIILLYILDLISASETEDENPVREVCIKILNVFNILISKGSVHNVLKLCVVCHNYWQYVRKMCAYVVAEDRSETAKKYRFEDQLLCLQLAPIFCGIIATPVENDAKELYVHKLFNLTCEISQRLVYYFRDMLLQLHLGNESSTLSARSVMYMTNILSRIVPMYVGVACDNTDDHMEKFLNKICSLAHQDVLRSVYLLRNILIEKHLWEAASFQSTSSLLSLESILTRIVPLYVGIKSSSTELEEMFCYELSQLMTKETVRSAYLYRDVIIQQKLLNLSLHSISNLLGVISVIGRERAVLVFQSFIYVLKHFVVYDGEISKESGDVGKASNPGGWGGEFLQTHHSSLLVAILDGLANLVRTFRITWRESVESLCLLTLAQQLLDSPNLSSKVGLTVQALHLIQLCIENFMPPNLALLTNSLSGTGLEHLGPLIFKRLHAPQWEVRDSSLEVLHVIATISNHKYPLFQELILENKLCEVAVHLAVNDVESYVCASATKCLRAMVCVDRLWNEELADKDLVNGMMKVLCGESEGVVRREASLLLCEIYKHRKVSSDILETMYMTMANVVVSDLYWEVKVNALNFWELVIERLMNDQGMIDGVFPSVTFSKEHRKIVSLTPTVIQTRLQKVLGELSRIGCLHVLLAAVNEEEDLEVVRKAAGIISSLSKHLELHGLLHLSNPSTPSDMSSLSMTDSANSESSVSTDISTATSASNISFLDMDPQAMGFAVLGECGVMNHALQDEVISSILDDRDINLIARVYQSSESELPGRQGPETKISKPIKAQIVLNPIDFIHQLEVVHVEDIVREKSRWIEDTGNDLSVLLDDMLILRDFQSDDPERNSVDCY